MPHALIVEDHAASLKSLVQLVQGEGFSTSTAQTLKEAREALAAKEPDLILSDLLLPDGSTLEVLKEFQGKPHPDIVLITGHASVDTAIEALRIGVVDYLTKPVDVTRLKLILTNIIRTRALKEEIGSLREELRKLGRFGPLIGASESMQRVYDLITRVAPTEATVLITGESGTGKELAAQTVHLLSLRRKAQFLPLNCGAVSPNLIESELFGHEKGSFTGANRAHKGYFERAHGGTLFLDEITEMPIELQVKLLRVLESGAFIRIGGDEQVAVDVRVVAATNRKPEEAVAAGKLREDLLYRLNVFPLQMPPLRERQGDVELLAAYFLEQLNKAEEKGKKITRSAIHRLKVHHWPGNVRELKNRMQRAYIMADDEITAECIACEIGAATEFQALSEANSALQFKVGTRLSEVERRMILATLDDCGGDKKKAADVLGLSLRTLYYRLSTYSEE